MISKFISNYLFCLVYVVRDVSNLFLSLLIDQAVAFLKLEHMLVIYIIKKMITGLCNSRVLIVDFMSHLYHAIKLFLVVLAWRNQTDLEIFVGCF